MRQVGSTTNLPRYQHQHHSTTNLPNHTPTSLIKTPYTDDRPKSSSKPIFTDQSIHWKTQFHASIMSCKDWGFVVGGFAWMGFAVAGFWPFLWQCNVVLGVVGSKLSTWLTLWRRRKWISKLIVAVVGSNGSNPFGLAICDSGLGKFAGGF